jgi:hypothetical protein
MVERKVALQSKGKHATELEVAHTYPKEEHGQKYVFKKS